MASRFRSISKPALNLLKSSINKPSSKSFFSMELPRSSPTFSRLRSERACLQSLLPLHSAVSSARLTSCLGIDSRGSRSLSQDVIGQMAVNFQFTHHSTADEELDVASHSMSYY